MPFPNILLKNIRMYIKQIKANNNRQKGAEILFWRLSQTISDNCCTNIRERHYAIPDWIRIR
jgi:hypothetical protein